MPTTKIQVNRAPVLTLWAAVVAEELGHGSEEALTLGRVLAGLNAASKARRIGLVEEREETKAEHRERAQARPKPDTVKLLGRDIPITQTPAGPRALEDDQPANPQAVERYLESRFGPHLETVEEAFRALARSRSKEELERTAYRLYEEFRPKVPEGERGWGAKGVLDLEKVRRLAEKESA